MDKHTQGPWTTGDADWRTIVGSETRYLHLNSAKVTGRVSRSLAAVAVVDRSDNEAEDLANARLIAAAPELLEALQLASATIERLKPSQPIDSISGTRDVINAAIAKATGERS